MKHFVVDSLPVMGLIWHLGKVYTVAVCVVETCL